MTLKISLKSIVPLQSSPHGGLKEKVKMTDGIEVKAGCMALDACATDTKAVKLLK